MDAPHPCGELLKRYSNHPTASMWGVAPLAFEVTFGDEGQREEPSEAGRWLISVSIRHRVIAHAYITQPLASFRGCPRSPAAGLGAAQRNSNN